ncbi:MAG TPA: site-2 protease family protein [Clostridiales bacterium]|jgi:Zn-dependent protease|nr:site-2 protease family protein [Clostridiales bacterium]
MRRFFSNPLTLLLLVVMAFQTITSGRFESPLEWLKITLMILPGILIGLTLHEFSHAFVAYRLGDPTPKQQGRVTINPLAHIDPVGMIALLFIGFGWGRPVEINPAYFRKRRRDEFLVAIAGVTMNFILAVIFMAALGLLIRSGSDFLRTDPGVIVMYVLSQIVAINLVLMIFNLLPIPPLDGFTILTEIFNLRHTQFYRQVYDKGFLLLILLILFNITGRVLSPAVGFLYQLLAKIFIGV